MAFPVATGRQNDLTPGFSATPDCANGWCSLCMDETRGRVTVPHGTHLPSLTLRAEECRLKATGGETPSHCDGVEVRGCRRVFSVGGSTTMVHSSTWARRATVAAFPREVLSRVTAQEGRMGGTRRARSRRRGQVTNVVKASDAIYSLACLPGSGQSGSTPCWERRRMLSSPSPPSPPWRWRGQTMPLGDAVHWYRCG
jgi:hypothetical protein